MLNPSVSFPVDQPQEPAFGAMLYFKQCRGDAIRKYKMAEFWVTRRDARRNALHYGRLVRKLEGRS